jgi:hypothetical protein
VKVPMKDRAHTPLIGSAILLALILESVATVGSVQKVAIGREWDAADYGLVGLVTRGVPNAARFPGVQVVSPPIEVPISGSAEAQRALIEIADQIPTPGPYFESSGRRLRSEYKDFLNSLDIAGDQLVKSSLADLENNGATPPFQFNPSISGLVRTFAAASSTPLVRWDAGRNDTQADTRRTALKLRVRLGRGRGTAALASDAEELAGEQFAASFSADGLEIVYVKPTGWFAQSLVERYKGGPFKPSAGGPWFGVGGRLFLCVRAIVLAKNPRFSLRLSQRSYQRVKQTVSAGGTIVVGSLIAGSGSSEIRFDDKESTISSETAGRTFAVAVLNEMRD